MSEAWLHTLLAMSYDVLPELREARNRYYSFWYFAGAAAILGWLTALVLYRIRSLREPAMSGLVVAAFALGGGLGWVIWRGLAEWSWGDVGVGSRWFAELSACILGCVGWLLVVGWLLLCRR